MSLKVTTSKWSGQLNLGVSKAPSRLTVKPAPKPQPISVKPIPKPAPIAVKPYVAPRLGAVTSRPTGYPYNPQQAGGGIQGSKPAIQAPPPKTTRVWYTTTYNSQTGSASKIKNVKALTDDEWRRETSKLQIYERRQREIEGFRKKWGNDIDYKKKIGQMAEDQVNFLMLRYEIGYNKRLRYLGQLEQQMNNSKDYNEMQRLWEKGKRLESEFNNWMIDMEANYSATTEAYQSEMDKAGIFGNSKLAKFGSKISDLFKKGGSFVWNYSLGTGNKNVPSTITTPKRILKFLKNVNTPDGRTLKESWQKTYDQKWVKPPPQANWVNKPGLANIPSNIAGKFTTSLVNKANSLGSFLTEEAFDPVNYFGAGTSGSKLKSFGKYLNKSADSIGWVNKAGKWGDKIANKPVFDDTKKFVKWLGKPHVTTNTKRFERKDKIISSYKQVMQPFFADMNRNFNKLRNNKQDIIQLKKDSFKEFVDIFDGFTNKMMKDFQNFRLSGAHFESIKDVKRYNIDQLRMFSKANKKMDDWAKRMEKMATESGKFKMYDVKKNGYTYKSIYERGRRENYYADYGNNKWNPFKTFDPELETTKMPQDFTKSRRWQRPRMVKGNSFIRNQARKDINYKFRSRYGAYGEKDRIHKEIDRQKRIQTFMEKVRDKHLERVDEEIKPSFWEKIWNTKIPISGRKSPFTLKSPMNAWKQSVLLYRPAWYANNELYSRFANATSGGFDALSGKNWKQYLQSLPKHEQKELTGTAFEEFMGVTKTRNKLSKGLGKLASNQENRNRVTLYRAWRNKGATHEEALKKVNDWHFDYQPKNWERPLRSVAPFWLWQKNITKRVATMPFETPRGASAWSKLYQNLYEKPLNSLPDQEIKYTDWDTGEQKNYNPRKNYEGKLKIGNNWVNTPMNAFTPEGINKIGLNPLITAWNEYATNRDKFGNKLNDVNWAENLARQFPQYNLIKQARESGWLGGTLKRDFDRWMARGSGFTKEAQGTDKTKTNYRESLDPKAGFWKNVASYMGIPSSSKFDSKEFDERKRYSEFNNEWFRTDWDAKFAKDYEATIKEQEKLANKYGFDLKKDIYGDKWSKYDTTFTKKQKRLKEQAREVNKNFWTTYNTLEAGVKGEKSGERTPFVQRTRLERQASNAFIKNPYIGFSYLRGDKNWWSAGIRDRGTADKSDDVDLTDPSEYFRWNDFWKRYSSASKEERKAMFANNPKYSKSFTGGTSGLSRYRATPKGQFWEKYWSITDPAQKSTYYKNNWKPEYGGKSSTKVSYRDTAKGKFWEQFYSFDGIKRLEYYRDNYKKEYGGKSTIKDPNRIIFWIKYYQANPQERVKMLRANPKYANELGKPQTSEQWDALREKNRNKEWAKLAGNKKFQSRRTGFTSDINRDVLTGTRATIAPRITWKV